MHLLHVSPFPANEMLAIARWQEHFNMQSATLKQAGLAVHSSKSCSPHWLCPSLSKKKGLCHPYKIQKMYVGSAVSERLPVLAFGFHTVPHAV